MKAIGRSVMGICATSLALVLGGCPGDEGVNDPCEGLPSGAACTWLGTKGEEGHNGDGHRVNTRVNQVQDLLFMPDGTAWFSDFNNYQIRRVHPDGQVETMVGWTDPPFPGDGPLSGIPAGGADGLDWRLNHPTTLLLGADGNVLLVGWHNHKLLNIDRDTGFVQVECGGGAGFAGDGGPASQALFIQPQDADYDEEGNLYIVDQQNRRIRRIDTADTITTIAGAGGPPADDGDGGPALEAHFAWQGGSNPNPSGALLVHEGKVYVSETESDRIRVIDLATGIIDAFAGTGVGGFAGDGGPAIDAQLNGPRDLELGPDGRMYVADTDNGAVRAIDLETGIIETVVGTGELGLDQEEQLPATETRLRRPFGISFDPEGNLYVMDSLNNRIVKVAR